MSEKIKILYVDDEMNNLIGFKASLRFDYQIFTAQNTSEALQYLNKYPDIKVIFCDQRMPHKTGVDFFAEIRSTHPYPIRILLTAYTDIESVIDAINKGHVFRYVKKPWIDADIISAIEEAVHFYEASSMLALKNQELHKAYSELDKFAYSVSHDIRGPLVGIAGGINLALNTHNLDEVKEILKMMNKSVQKLDDFILSMHDYYSLERGELKITDIDFRDLIKEMEDVYEIYAKTLSIAFKIHLQQEESFWSDRVSIFLIINNLLSNAFKYQILEKEDKFVSLNIVVEKGIATIIVADNGSGIDEKYKNQIFDLFFRAHIKEAGSGFGLFNVKSALLKLNGQVEVDSELNQGTTFTIKIPNK
ncbi:hybrid sensor histidine kinase/response regulator [Pedobacter glucosidilyticus]|uniref:hybrid sensor histidine kinase/response regulator n=1 Tax=Pedobacter glucosidilyticus TaxID=1122941 RepID=UPI0003FCEDFD|nr:hybrid sensor histidine kinase/response regulator [Pedobacter glucosidilyticus]